MLSGSRDLRFEDFVRVLEGFGFELRRTSGSHRVFVHRDVPRPFPVQPRSDGKAKPYQIDQFLKLIEQHDLELSED
ncbi:MAG: type II toxin-antitoxin system HicA family toxin [Chloroflexota bacterium]|nr:type II toxin-antitoxin system HicA family toxin [Chloroflexota bacterium]